MGLGTDQPSVFKDRTNLKMIGFDMAKVTAEKVFKEAGLTINDVNVSIFFLVDDN